MNNFLNGELNCVRPMLKLGTHEPKQNLNWNEKACTDQIKQLESSSYQAYPNINLCFWKIMNAYNRDMFQFLLFQN